MMSNNSYVNRLRAARTSESVIKTRFVTLFGASDGRPIFVFEGDDDKVVYGRWIRRIHATICYEVFVCKGKKAVSVLKRIIDRDLSSIGDGTYFFVDRDFDDLTMFDNDIRVFMTDRYSVENYMVSPDVLDSVLRDEFPLDGQPGLRAAIVEIFRSDYSDFLLVTRPFNERLYLCRKLSIVLDRSLSDKLCDYAEVCVGSVAPGEKPLSYLVSCDLPTAQENYQDILAEFAGFAGEHRYRGKNAQLFFRGWLNSLLEHLGNGSGPFQGANIVGSARQHELTLGTFASKSPMPLTLPTFLEGVAV